jgi:beta-glucanase (GH16 family)
LVGGVRGCTRQPTQPGTATWTAELGGGGWGLNQLQHYTDSPDNAAVNENGCLVITARRVGERVTSARLITKNKVHLRYGRIEARIQVPTGRGMCAALWMLGAAFDPADAPDLPAALQ